MEFLIGLLIAGFVFGVPIAGLIGYLVQRERMLRVEKRTAAMEAELGATRQALGRLRAQVAGLEPSERVPAATSEPAQPVVPSPVPVVPAEPIVRDEPVAPAIPAPPLRPRSRPATVAAPSSPRPASRDAGLERQLGTRAAVWVGAVAFALAGAFLVKYTFDHSLLGPAARLILGSVFGLALLGSGEWIRRRSASIAQGLAASGIAVLFAVLLAGINLYHLIPPAAGFPLLALTTAVAVGLSLRHGPFVALLGLLGGFMTPAWIGAAEPSAWTLFTYLLLLQCGLLFVSHRRNWWPIAALTVVGGLGWAAAVVAGWVDYGGTTAPVALFLLSGSVSLVYFLGNDPSRRTGSSRTGLGLAYGGLGISTLLVAALVGRAGFGWTEWIYFALLGAGALYLGRRARAYEGLPWIAAAIGAVTLFVWGGSSGSSEPVRVWWTGLILATLFSGGARACMWGARNPGRWSALSASSGVLYFLAVWAAAPDRAWPLAWGTQSLIAAAAFTALAWSVWRAREGMKDGNQALAAPLVAVTTFVSLAAPLELERAWISVAWALEVPVLIWLARRLDVPALVRLAWALAAGTLVRLVLNPFVVDYPIGVNPVLNWLAWGYGVPMLALAVAARLSHDTDHPRTGRGLSAGAIALGFAWATLAVRQLFHPGELDAFRFELGEWGALTVVWLGGALGLLAAHRRTSYDVFRVAGLVIGGIALVQALLAQNLLANPLVVRYSVGATVIFNSLLFVYGLPAALLTALAWITRRGEPRALSALCGGAALSQLFLMVTLMVRQGFQGTVLAGGATTPAEMYTYSLAWVLLATALLVAGVLTGGPVLRYGSAAVMVLAVGKVFLIDTANLQDLYRVLSLFGLGVSLMLLAFLYQRFVFGNRASPSLVPGEKGKLC